MHLWEDLIRFSLHIASINLSHWPLTSGMRRTCQFTLAVVSLHSFTLHWLLIVGCWIMRLVPLLFSFNGIDHKKIEIQSPFINRYVVPDLYDFLWPVKHTFITYIFKECPFLTCTFYIGSFFVHFWSLKLSFTTFNFVGSQIFLHFWKKCLKEVSKVKTVILWYILQIKTTDFRYVYTVECNVFVWCIFSIITPVFSVTWSFRNHSDMLIWCSRNISFYFLC